jgi:dephospho-CoA kinase
MLKIGVTGSFGSGKTTVAAMFKKRGAVIVDTDGIVHRLLKDHKGCRKAVGQAFGAGILSTRGVDRIKLARIVFTDRKALKKLEAILHPLAWQETLKIFRSARRQAVVIDAPLLIEAKWHRKVDAVVVVKARLSQQIKRIKLRTGLRKADALRRIRRQMSLKDKLKYADFVVDNSGPKTDTDRQIARIWNQLKTTINQEE